MEKETCKYRYSCWDQEAGYGYDTGEEHYTYMSNHDEWVYCPFCGKLIEYVEGEN